MNITPRISIILPVYNAEKYIHRCIDSILNQTFKDFEILLIDDGSPDRSGEICDDYAKKDSRVRAFHKENGGVASARQVGIDNAVGEYSIHVDADDWVEENMLEELYKAAKDSDADMVYCDYYEEIEGKQTLKQMNPIDHSIITAGDIMFRIGASLWRKLIRTECYKKYDIRFIEGFNHGEDLLVALQLCSHKEIITKYLPKAFYHYVRDVNTDSITSARKTYTREDFDYDSRFLGVASRYIEDIEDFNIQYREIVASAFCHKLFSSKEFKQRFYKDRKIFLNYGIVKGLLLYISAIGLNWVSFPLYKFYKKINTLCQR
ncbi:MAG: glycosyltransferase [Bacteroidales bacterium]|nr:glycosyltransferase [Bacteroidales bacterium]